LSNAGDKVSSAAHICRGQLGMVDVVGLPFDATWYHGHRSKCISMQRGTRIDMPRVHESIIALDKAYVSRKTSYF